jgi:hypothetical protein
LWHIGKISQVKLGGWTGEEETGGQGNHHMDGPPQPRHLALPPPMHGVVCRSFKQSLQSHPPVPTPGASFAKLPNSRWAKNWSGSLLRQHWLPARERRLPFMEGLGFFLDNSSGLLLSNGRDLPPASQTLPTEVPTGPPTVSLPTAVEGVPR